MSQPLLQILNRIRSLNSLKSIHSRLIIEASILSSDLILNKFLRLYSRFGAIRYARNLFDEIPQPNSFLWTSLAHGYVENRQYLEALAVFNGMRSESVAPLNFTIATVVKALAREKRVKNGEAVYGIAVKFGLDFDITVQNAVIDLFMRCSEADFAREVFEGMEERDVVSWNSMVSGYGNNGRVDVAREFFNMMPEKNTISWTSMICGYIKDGNMMEASVLFERMPVKDLASWNVMVSGYINGGDMVSAVHVFEAMPIRDIGTWNLMISGFCKAKEMKVAEEFFSKMVNRNVVSWSIMIDGYMKAGDVKNARSLFDQMAEKNLVSWSIMIEGYAKNGQPHDALAIYKDFKGKGFIPDETFILGVISACSQLGVIDTAESIISNYLQPSAFSNIRIVTSLIDMYAKCGSITKALQIFKMAHQKDLQCYSSMIAAFANNGSSQDAIDLFDEMQKENIRPDGVAFLGVLTACNHGGLVDDGRKFFKQMTDEFKILPLERHYACVIDLLGRAGCLEEAYNVICDMPIVPNEVIWGALLAACRVHCNVELAEIAASELFKIEPTNSGNYVLLSNIYAAAGMWDGVAKVRAMIREHRVLKNRGSSWVEIDCIVHEFFMGDTSHTDSETIYIILHLLNDDMKLLGNMVHSEMEITSPLHTLEDGYQNEM